MLFGSHYCLGFLLCLSSVSTYRVAVAEFYPDHMPDPTKLYTRQQAQGMLYSNVLRFEPLLQQARQSNASLVLFPEDALYGSGLKSHELIFPFLDRIPNPEENSIPCTHWNASVAKDALVLYALSCFALKYRLYIVVDLGDKQPCFGSDCPSTQYYQYNTQVVFSNAGQIIQKYYKQNLFHEPQFDIPVNQSIKTFTTDTGITFGMGICFDILFEYPMVEMVKQGIHTILFSSWWINTPPMLSGTAMQRAWSYHFGIDLIAAGSGSGWFNSGSGIYSSGKILQTYYNDGFKPANKVMIASMPNKMELRNIQPVLSGNAMRNTAKVIKNASAIKYLNTSLNFSETLQLSLSTIQCELTYGIGNFSDPKQVYIMMAVEGFYDDWLFPISSCGLYACPLHMTGGLACGAVAKYPLEGKTLFSKATLSVQYSPNAELAALPVLSEKTSQLFEEWNMTRVGDESYILNLLQPKKLLQFSIMGRDYSGSK